MIVTKWLLKDLNSLLVPSNLTTVMILLFVMQPYFIRARQNGVLELQEKIVPSAGYLVLIVHLEAASKILLFFTQMEVPSNYMEVKIPLTIVTSITLIGPQLILLV